MKTSKRTKKALVLLSGGMDSATVLAIAREQGFECYALSVDYGQRHAAELNAASSIAKTFEVREHLVISIPIGRFLSSSLTDPEQAIPENTTEGIPTTYVPARNTLFLALALGWAESLSIQDLFIGVTAVDYSGYPDCRPEFINAFEQLANLATKAGVEGGRYQIHTPLIELSKADIVRRGVALGVDYANTVTCYQADSDGRACGRCDACRLRKKGFAEAEMDDPTCYQS